VSSDGKKCLIVFVPDGRKVTTNSYQALLCQHMMLWLIDAYPEGNRVFQQEGAPALPANLTQRFLENKIVAQ
jgi:hypothetical protein